MSICVTCAENGSLHHGNPPASLLALRTPSTISRPGRRYHRSTAQNSSAQMAQPSLMLILKTHIVFQYWQVERCQVIYTFHNEPERCSCINHSNKQRNQQCHGGTEAIGSCLLHTSTLLNRFTSAECLIVNTQARATVHEALIDEFKSQLCVTVETLDKY